MVLGVLAVGLEVVWIVRNPSAVRLRWKPPRLNDQLFLTSPAVVSLASIQPLGPKTGWCLLAQSGYDGHAGLKELMHSLLVNTPEPYPASDEVHTKWLRFSSVRRALYVINGDGCYKSGQGKGPCMTALNNDKMFKQGTVSKLHNGTRTRTGTRTDT